MNLENFMSDMKESKIALLPTIKGREKSLKQVVNCLYDQVDFINIVFNGYDSIPNWISEFPKITAKLQVEDKYAACSVWLHQNLNGYIFVVDDDIIYPPNYIEKMKSKIDEYERKAIIVVHGAEIKIPYTTYNKSCCLHHFKFSCDKDVKVDIAGVGTSAFHTDTFNPGLSDFKYKYLRDVQFSTLAAKQSIPIICIKRDDNWLMPITTLGITICDTVISDNYWSRLKDELISQQLIPVLK